MKHTTIIFILLVFMAAFGVKAQMPNANHCPPSGRAYQWLLSAPDVPTKAEQQFAQYQAAQQKQHQFWLKTEKFINSWTALAREYNDKGTFNVKKAKQVSKAFHELEKTEGWPK